MACILLSEHELEQLIVCPSTFDRCTMVAQKFKETAERTRTYGRDTRTDIAESEAAAAKFDLMAEVAKASNGPAVAVVAPANPPELPEPAKRARPARKPTAAKAKRTSRHH